MQSLCTTQGHASCPEKVALQGGDFLIATPSWCIREDASKMSVKKRENSSLVLIYLFSLGICTAPISGISPIANGIEWLLDALFQVPVLMLWSLWLFTCMYSSTLSPTGSAVGNTSFALMTPEDSTHAIPKARIS